jgi:hypothetical protein
MVLDRFFRFQELADTPPDATGPNATTPIPGNTVNQARHTFDVRRGSKKTSLEGTPNSE